MDAINFILPYLYWSFIIVFSFLFSSTLLWISTRAMKFKEPLFKKALKATLVEALVMVALMVVLYLIIFSFSGLRGPSIMMLLPVLMLFSFVSFLYPVYIIRRTYDETWLHSLLAYALKFILSIASLTLLCGIVFLFMAVFVMPGNSLLGGATSSAPISEDWEGLFPVLSSIRYASTDQFFRADFVNGKGTGIRISEAGAREYYSGMNCSTVSVEPAAVSGGQSFRIRLDCKDAALSERDKYRLDMYVTYSYTVSGMNRTHKEEGRISGTVE